MQQGHQGQLYQGDLQQAGGLLPAVVGGGPSGQEGRGGGGEVLDHHIYVLDELSEYHSELGQVLLVYDGPNGVDGAL